MGNGIVHLTRFTLDGNHWQIQGGANGMHPPPLQQDQFLLFSHMFSPKSVCVGGGAPPTGNPGSATGNCVFFTITTQSKSGTFSWLVW